ncbi:MAG TPA: DUF167 domain-containing protein [Nitrososphaera sp.]|nr:DUF167 domain-containing protein [Nitrososphaera sp.]
MLYAVTVKFGSTSRLEVNGESIAAIIKAPPHRGKANAELLKLISRHFGVDQSRIRIVSGLTTRKKMVQIS